MPGNLPWDTKTVAEMVAAWNSTKAPASVFAREYAESITRTADAIRIKIGALIREEVIEPMRPSSTPLRFWSWTSRRCPCGCTRGGYGT